ncbi:MAG: hypothetical protein HC945_04100, partial [Nitrosarchaeum sp.]|nr:hypothetical protein [Nitrosarchaeum sp.]
MPNFNIRQPPRIETKDINTLGPTIGTAREGTILSVDQNRGTVKVGFNLSKNDLQNNTYTIPIPGSWYGPDGEFAGGYPKRGSTVRCIMGQGGRWSIIGYVPNDGVYLNTNTNGVSSYQGNLLGALRPDRYLIQVKNNIRAFLDPSIGIQIGNPNEYIHADPVSHIISNTFIWNMAFSQGHQIVIGP